MLTEKKLNTETPVNHNWLGSLLSPTLKDEVVEKWKKFKIYN